STPGSRHGRRLRVNLGRRRRGSPAKGNRVTGLLPLLALAAMSAASVHPTPVDPGAVDALMRDYAGDVPGAAVLVLRDGEPVLRRGYGLAELEEGTPVDPRTNFRLAS